MGDVDSVERLRSRAERADALLEVTKLLSESVDDPRRLGDLIADRIAHLVGDAVTVWVLPPGDDTLEAVATAHPDPDAAGLLDDIQRSVNHRSGGGIATPVVQSGNPLVVVDYDMTGYRDEIDPAYWPWLERYGVSSLTVLPMRARGRVVGAVGTTRDAGRPAYSGLDVEFMQALADCAAIAIDNAHLLREATLAQESLRRQSEIVDQVSDAIFMVDVDGRIASWNAAAEAIYGQRADEVVGRPAASVLRTVFLDADGTELTREEFLERRMIDGFWRGEIRERHADGRTLQLLCSSTVVPAGDGTVSGYVCVNRDLSAERAATHEALHDPLTGLPNRRLLGDRLTHALARAARRGSRLAVLFVDLDGFKSVNDTYGHGEGDLLLRTCARRLLRAMRASDTVTRLGGDEFVVLAEDVGSADGASRVATRVLECLTVEVPVRGRFVSVRASVGVALSRPDDDAERLIRRADAAMYAAKRSGAGRWQLDDDEVTPAMGLPA